MTKFNSARTSCNHGHTHASAKEARRCSELHLLLRAGHITALSIEPTFKLIIAGTPIKTSRGSVAKYRPDFAYIEGNPGKPVAEDVKTSATLTEASKLRMAVFRAAYPQIELRVLM